MDLPGIDLNLLVALRALLRERNVTRAGEAIGLSQPATSAALARLRRHFGDDLLTRDGQRYILTPLGTSLLDQAEVALRYVEHTFAARPSSTPPAPTASSPWSCPTTRSLCWARNCCALSNDRLRTCACASSPPTARPSTTHNPHCVPPTSWSSRVGTSPTCPPPISTGTAGYASAPLTTRLSETP